MREIDPKTTYDVVVIGAGVAGLTAAALISRFNMSVRVLEMDSRPGGYLAGFKRKEFRFDSAIHWLNQCGPTGYVTKVFDLIGSDHPAPLPLHSIKRFIGDSFNYLLTDNPDELRDQWISEFPHEKDGLIRFFADAKKLGRSFDSASNLFRSVETMNIFETAMAGMKRARFAIPFIKHLSYTGDEGVKKGLNRYFKEEKLHKVFCSEPDMLSCLVPIAWAYYGDYQSPPKGGSQVMPEWLHHVVNEMGNDVFFQSRVKEIIVEGKTCKGVSVINKGKEHLIRSNYTIAACDVKTLYEKMLPAGIIPDSMIKKLNEAELYGSSVTVQLALDCPVESLGFGKEMIFIAQDGLPRKDYGNGDPHTSGLSILAPSIIDPSVAPKGKGIVTIYVAASIDYCDYWQTERDDEGGYVRGQAYKDLKQEYANILIKRVEKMIAPELSDHIEYCDIATPITHWRYTGNRDGSIMGARPGKKNMKAGVAHYRTPVKNLLLGGQWAELGGGVPIAVKAAANAAILIFKKESPEKYRLLADYMDGDLQLGVIQGSPLLQRYADNWKQEPTPAEKLEK